MANEATVTVGLRITKGKLSYQNQPGTYQATVEADPAFGPTPGAILATTYGTDVDLSQLTTPGLCRIMNLDEDNYVEVGVWDPETGQFYPVTELLPGEQQVIRLSRNFGVQYAGTGTGTTSPTNTLRVKANSAPCPVLIEAFER